MSRQFWNTVGIIVIIVGFAILFYVIALPYATEMYIKQQDIQNTCATYFQNHHIDKPGC